MSIDATTVLISLLSSIGGGAVVALVNHWLTLRRESLKKEDDLKIQRRINAWRNLEKACLMHGPDTEITSRLKDDFDYAFAELMLLGTAEEIALAERYASNASKPNGEETPELADLLNELRTTLRKEMGLEPVEPMQRFFRLKRRRD